jgi:predicted XRE-type DNA-binding protein
MEKMKQEFASVWDALADAPEEAANLRVRSALMQQIAAIVETSGWTQAEADLRRNVTQPRIDDLLRGRISRFSLDALVNGVFGQKDQHEGRRRCVTKI